MEILLELENVTRSYGGGAEAPAVDGVSFRLPRGSFWAVMGPSGCGKSTLLNMISTIDRPTAGRIRLGGRDLARRLEIEPVLDRFPNQVSGGQRQRCACARALAARPDLLLADEPTGALDSRGAKNLMELLSSLSAGFGTTVLMVTHDAFSASWCEKILLMGDGRITGSLDRAGRERRAFFLDILDRMAAPAGEDRRVS